MTNQVAQQQKDWASDFYQEASKKANEVVKEAYDHSSHYNDAIKYVRKIKQLSFGEVPDQTAHTSMRMFELVCDLAIYLIRQDAQNLPIQDKDKEE